MSVVDDVVQGVHEYYLIDDIARTERIKANSMCEAIKEYKKNHRWEPMMVIQGREIKGRAEYYDK